jgi:adenosylmethionine-8-amino-7-oxononanoate aminotransferase
MIDLLSADKQNIWHPFTPLVGAEDPILISSAEGVYINTHDGKKIIDAVSSWWVNIHGHAHPYIAQALSKQASVLEHVIFAGFTHAPAIQLSENLLTILPSNQSKIFFSDNGSTAVEVALKIAIQYWHNIDINRKTVIAIQGAYHGDTFGAMSVGERSIFTDAFSSYLFTTEFIDFPYRDNEEKVLKQFKEIIDNHEVAAFIFEPLVQGAAGMRMYGAAILDSMISYAQSKQIICIADEVFTGFGRTGKLFASDYLTKAPDIIAISKGLTGGTLPLGITSCATNIVKAFESAEVHKTFFHGHSYTANPLACAAANASFDLLMKKECQQRIYEITQQQQHFAQQIKPNKNIRDVRHLGTIIALELMSSETTSYTNTIRKKIYTYFLERGVLLRPLGNVIYIVPPYVITDTELSIVHNAILQFLNDL